MLTLLKINRYTKEIEGWFIAENFNQAAQLAGSAGEVQLANYCYTNEWNLDNRRDARFNLPVNEGGSHIYTVLR